MPHFLNFKNQKGASAGQAGLTLIEAIVSLVILVSGLIPAVYVISASLNTSSIIKNNLIAANLAQEGVEVIRSLRDANWFNPAIPSFDNGLIGTWQVDWNTNWNTNPPQAITVDTSPFIKFDASTGLYNYIIGSNTQFKRTTTIALTPNACNCELVVISRVDWLERGGRARVVQVESHLFDWR